MNDKSIFDFMVTLAAILCLMFVALFTIFNYILEIWVPAIIGTFVTAGIVYFILWFNKVIG